MSRFAAILRCSIAFAGYLAVGAAAHAFETADLIGKWGVAAYFDAKDAGKMLAAAQSACGQPYTIARGKTGGAMMYSGFTGKPVEVVVSGDRIVNADDSDAGDEKRIVEADGRVLKLRYTNAEKDQRYGTMVFVRCGKK